jgi:hypothetical protein
MMEHAGLSVLESAVFRWQYGNSNARSCYTSSIAVKPWKALDVWLGYKDSNLNCLIQTQ